MGIKSNSLKTHVPYLKVAMTTGIFNFFWPVFLFFYLKKKTKTIESFFIKRFVTKTPEEKLAEKFVNDLPLKKTMGVEPGLFIS